MKKYRTAVIATTFALLAGCANEHRSRDLANPNVTGETLAQQVCSNCHGVTGNATSPNFPNLAGQPKLYLAGQLSAFKAHRRQDPAGFEYMWGLSRNLTDKQVGELADYFATQAPQKQRRESEAGRVAPGRAIYADGRTSSGIPPCGPCHGNDGEGTVAFPRLAGQHADYLVKQLTVFKRTDERPDGSVMKVIAHNLTQDDILDVAAYLQDAVPER